MALESPGSGGEEQQQPGEGAAAETVGSPSAAAAAATWHGIPRVRRKWVDVVEGKQLDITIIEDHKG